MNQKQSVTQFIQKASAEMKADPQAVKSAVESGDLSRLTASLRPEQWEQAQEILNDPNKLKQLLNSPMGKALLKQLGQ